MKRSLALWPAAALVAAMLSGPAHAQLNPQTVTLMKVDPQTLATGYRSSKMVGSSVSNENNETVGTIDDLIITEGGQAPYAILSVGGFLGLGTKYVALPFTSLKIVDKKVVLPGAQRKLCRVFPTSNTILTAEVRSSAHAVTVMSG